MTVPVTLPKEIGLQYQNSLGEWVTVARCDTGSVLRTRRLAMAPGQSVTAQKWRVVRLHAKPAEPVDLDTAVMRLTRIEVRRETAELSPFKRWSFDFDASEQRYGLVATDGNVEVFRRGVRVASIPSPYNATQLVEVKRAQMLDTLLAFHQDVQPYRFGRQGAHDEWDSRPQAFDNLPIYDYDGTRAGGINEVQQLSFVEMVNGDTFNLVLEEQVTASIAFSSSLSSTAAAVSSALQALPNVGANGVSVTVSGDNIMVAFQNQNRAEDVGDMAAQVLVSEKGMVRTSTVTQGREGGEPMVSATRGWPSVGVFFDGRLWLGGLKSRPQTILGSRSGFFFDFTMKGTQTDDKGISVDLATEQSTRIMNMFAGRHLQVFSQSAEFFCASQPVTPPPSFPRTSSVGIQPATPLLEMEGGTLMVQAGGDTISHYAYSDSSLSYGVMPLSSYASHIVKGIVAGGFRRHRSTSEPNLALYMRADGNAVAMSAILSQDVLGFAPWTTNGAFVEAGGELAGDLYVGTRRTVNGQPRHCLEVVSDQCVMDASVLMTGEHSRVEGLDHLEGQTVALYIDGGDEGDAVVTDGAVTLPRASQRSIEVGLNFEVRGRILPLVLNEDPRGGASMKARAGEINFRLGPTGNLRAGMTGKKMWPVSLKRRGEGALLDHGSGEDAFEGWTRLYPIPGFQNDAQIEWEQLRPGPLEIREVVVTVQT